MSNSTPRIQSRSNDKEQDEKLLEPFTYICQIPGKNIRSKLTRAFNHWMKIPEDTLSRIEEIVHILHNSSLLMDDIQDSSIVRRGVPVAHSIYGVPSSINASNYCLWIVLERVLELNRPEAVIVYNEQLLELHRGQGMELYWRENFLCPREEEYIQMAKRKTGGLFMLAIRLMQLFSEDKSDYTNLAGTIGLYFQIRDDYLNLKSKNYAKHKSFCEDLTEGKFSFPIIHAIKSNPEDRRVSYILRQRTKDVDLKKYCITLLTELGSFEYTLSVLCKLQKEALAELDKLGDNVYMEQLLNSLFELE
ncbi:geranylgeranyl pyrophosphate synthase-like [Coccinella septempunctata]|uniref:geranylgeranyl pyrophosphate synthase-like n=1 Tax=Coccinella septempunctata TaxID=41139 RepID=UPI001D092653|nr:geranylgeranyl pyrophosphate synthase-like [Coccinella septempunctata]